MVRRIAEITTISSTIAPTRPCSTRAGTAATISTPATVAGRRPSITQPNAAQSMWRHSVAIVARGSPPPAIMIATGTSSGRTSATMGDAMAPRPKPTLPCTRPPNAPSATSSRTISTDKPTPTA